MTSNPLQKVLSAMILTFTMSVSVADVALDSREYKILLNPTLFKGDSTMRSHKVDAYWDTLKQAIENGSIKHKTSGHLTLSKNRTVIFYDVQGSCDLFNAGYIFRERVDNGKRQVTLKYRSSDPLIASSKKLNGSKSTWESKFEEDISVPFISQYSLSTKQKIGKSKKLNKMDDPIRLYRDLKNENFDETLQIKKVGGLTVTEIVYKKANVALAKVDADFSLTFWYNESVSTTEAIVAEISFKYEGLQNTFSDKVAIDAKELFTRMQRHSTLVNWNATNSMTKTATVYQYQQGFCE